MNPVGNNPRFFTRWAVVVIGFVCLVFSIAGRVWPGSKPEQHRTRLQTPVQTPVGQTPLVSLIMEGHQLHASLQTRQLDSVQDLPTGITSPENPHVSSNREFIEAVARGGSQGRHDGAGMRAALFARYWTSENEVGFYGLEAESDAHADQREKWLREVWAYNARLDRASVHRQDRLLFVVWHDGVGPECWKTVNAKFIDRLNGPNER